MKRENKYRAFDGNNMLYRGLFDRNWYTSAMGGKCVSGITPNDKHTLKVMEYIGLKDKEDVDIYEGDIVRIIHPCWENKCEVKFIHGCFCFVSIDKVNEGSTVNGFSFMREKWKIEVVGNIHEN